MRVLLTIDSFLQVVQIESAFIHSDSALYLHTPVGTDDIAVLGLAKDHAEMQMQNLLCKGHADLSAFPATRIPAEDRSEDNCEDTCEYECVCACGACIQFGRNIFTKGSVFCPQCGDVLTFEFEETASPNTPVRPRSKRSSPEIEQISVFRRLFSAKRRNQWD